ncbi:MAG: hypothetical protein GXP13_01325 [Gammaproteobacteria bacterium]|nr:hypothetical protein [Gammaproteobacteria bacterium]
MKYYRLLLIAILVLSTNVYAYQPKIEIIEQFDNLRMIAFISAKDVNTSPQWNPDLGTPSLTVGEAVQAVRNFTRSTNIIVKEIEIRPLPNYEAHWHYLIKVVNNEMKTKFSIYVVLMNGKVIPAIVEPEGYK